MHNLFLQDFAVVMIVAGLVTVVFHRFKQPVVLGYIVAGIIIGPHTPPYSLIHDEKTINTLAELGLVMLMFSLGLEFSLRKLKQVGASAFIAAFVEILLMAWLGYETGLFFGWSKMDSIFLGGILSISSTTIIVKALAELGKSKEPFARLIFGILIIEDVLGIAIIALLSGIATTGTLELRQVASTFWKLGVFLVVAIVVGLITVPRLLKYISRFRSSEMLLVTVLGLCFGVCLVAAKLGYSVALGAFVIGAVIAESREIHQIEVLVEPVRDMFSAIFFVAIGLMIDPVIIAKYWLPTLVITIAVVLGKVLSCSFGAFAGGNDSRTSLRIGMGLAQIGEFSFIIASLGLSLKVTSDFLYPVAVAVSAVTTFLTPYLIKSTDGIVNAFDRAAPRWIVNYLELYTRWVGSLGSDRQVTLESKLLKRWSAQMAINGILIAAVFIAAAYLQANPPRILEKQTVLSESMMNDCLWLLALVFSLPMLVATYRKLQALGLLIAETRVTVETAGERTGAIRAFVAQLVPLVGAIVMALYVIVLSSAILPPVDVLLVLVGLAMIVAALLYRSFVKLYSRAQAALQETLAAEPDHEKKRPAHLLAGAALEHITLTSQSVAVGKLIRELQLRTKTGASIVGIERNGQSIINPDSDEELHAGDQLLLIGDTAQLQRAAAVLNELTA